MGIIITKGIGEGVTALTPFDNALINSSVANYNPILLSSVIPENNIIKQETYVAPLNEYGHSLHVVMARRDEDKSGKIACAGVACAQDKESKYVIFVKHHGREKAAVNKEIHDKLVCTVATTVYKSQNWDS